MALDTEYALHNILADTAAQASTIAPDKAQDKGFFNNDTNSLNQVEPLRVNADGFYDQNKRGAADRSVQGFYTEEDAGKKAKAQQNQSTASASAANGSYWNRMLAGYQRRR